MRNFSRDSRGGGRDGGFDRDRVRQMHKAVCSECGADCQVPFRPTGDRPIFCSDCFSKQQGDTRFEKPRGEYREKPRFDDKRMFTAVCNKCGNKCEVPFRPNGEKPVYCQQCFGRNKGSDSSLTLAPTKEKDSSGQLEMINSKLDKILKLLSPATVSTAVPVVTAPKPEAEEKKTKKGLVKTKAVAKKAKKK